MIRFKRLLLLLMVIEKIRGVRNCLIILTTKGVFGQTGRGVRELREASGASRGSQAGRVFLDMFVSRRQLTSSTSPSSVRGTSRISSPSPLPYSMFNICSAVVSWYIFALFSNWYFHYRFCQFSEFLHTSRPFNDIYSF